MPTSDGAFIMIQRIRSSRVASLVAALLVGAPLALCPPTHASVTSAADQPIIDVRTLVATARDRVFPALVNIEVISLEFAGGKENKIRATGSGTIITPDGLVLTNAHVTDEGNKFWLTLSDKQRVPGTLVGEDPWTDLAVLRIDLSKLADPKTPLPHAEFGDSTALAVGDYVLAMGSPFSLSRTVTLGIVSNTERVFTSMRDAGEVEDQMLNWEQRTGLFTNWIQHDALINPGNSGGPLVGLDGKIIGVNTRGGAGLAFATPSSMARQVFKELVEHAEVVRSSIGASFRHLQGTGIEAGVLVDSVDADGPGAAAGLKAGDVVTSIDAEKVTVRFAEEIPPLLKRIADRPVGSTITLAYTRSNQPGEVKIPTEKLLKDKGEEAALRTWGLTAQRITERMAQQRRFSSTKGALVTSLRQGGPAQTAEPSLGWGDVVLAVDGRPISSLADLIAQYERITALKDKPEWLLVEFERQNKSFLTLIKPKPEDRPDPPPELPKAWIGIATQPVIRNLAEKLGSADNRGFRVVRVYSGTEAAKSGLKVGDIILDINGDRLAPRGLADAGALSRAVRALAIDSQAKLKIVRDGSPTELALTLERTRQTPEEAPRIRNTDFEMAVRDITFFDREDNKWDNTVTGVYVDQAESAGWAGLAGIVGGDLIQRIGDTEITDAKSYKAAMEQVSKTQPERIVFVVFRGSRTFFRFVEPDWKPTTKE